MSFRPWSWCQESSCLGASSLEMTASQIQKGWVMLGTWADPSRGVSKDQDLFFDAGCVCGGVWSSCSLGVWVHHGNRRRSCMVGLPFPGKWVVMFFLCHTLYLILFLFFQGTTWVDSYPLIIILIPIYYYHDMAFFYSMLNYNRIYCVWLSGLSGSLRLFYLASQQEEIICYVTFGA